MKRLSNVAAAVCLALAAACQAVLGDFTVEPVPAEEPAAGLGTACEPGAYRCNDESLETCNDERTGFVVVEACRSAAECNLNSRACRPCVPGERMCRANTIETCGADGTWQYQADCASAALCNVAPDRMSATCTTPACERAGAHECREATLVRCSAGQDYLEPVALCETPELCDAAHADELAASGARGACRPPACEPDAFRCDGATLSHCSDDRTRFIEVGPCDSSDLCSAALGACGACEAGSVECNEAELRRCTAGGAWETLERCEAATLCDANAGRCRSAECPEPGALRCGGPLLEVCSDELVWETAEACETVELCSVSAGRCLPPSCSADETRCQGDRFETCSRDLTRWEPIATCPAGELCDPEDGCVPAPCTENAVRCNGANLERCVGGRYEHERHCATAVLCLEESASCMDPACPPGPVVRCRNPTIAERCLPGRDGFEDFHTCQMGSCDQELSSSAGYAACVECDPNAYRCNGTELLRCASDGLGEDKVNTCPTSCAVTNGVPACG